MKLEEIMNENFDSYYTNDQKTVERGEICAIVAYMTGVDDSRLDGWYASGFKYALQKARDSKEATIIRYLCNLRNSMLNHFRDLNQKLYNLTNIDSIEYFDNEEIKKLQEWGVNPVMTNSNSESYIKHITELVSLNIDRCKNLFPEYVNFSYIRNLFYNPKFRKEGVLKAEFDKYHQNKRRYPFACYINWTPNDYGYLFADDGKFLKELYKQNGDTFNDSRFTKDASSSEKQAIINFIHESEKTIIAVDCENCDPYKFYSVIKGFDLETTESIAEIMLFDDDHTSAAWDYIESLINIKVQHVEIQRILDRKSLVDQWLSLNVCKAFYEKRADSFILCSSDSDFLALISLLPDARFIVMNEHEKSSQALLNAFKERGVYNCALDSFYQGGTKELQHMVLKSRLAKYKDSIIGMNYQALVEKIFDECYIEKTKVDMDLFIEKYMKKLSLKIDNDGNYYIYMPE